VIEGPLSKHIPVDVYVPGCPPHPDAIIEGIARAAEILATRGVAAKAKGEPQR
jgi:Ni,Fe-hydrogenase III small subunit